MNPRRRQGALNNSAHTNLGCGLFGIGFKKKGRRSCQKDSIPVADLGGPPLISSPADFGRLMAEETEKWARWSSSRGSRRSSASRTLTRCKFATRLVSYIRKNAVVRGRCVMKKVLACTMFLGVVSSLPAAADDTKLRFKGGIGVIPVSSGVAVAPKPGTAPVVESVNRNIVRGVQPAGQIWVIDELDAKVSANGRITIDGKGLVICGRNSAGLTTG